MRMAIRTSSCAALLVAVALTVPAAAQDRNHPLDLATFPATTLEITHHDASHAPHKYSFQVWVADTPERGAQGLMFVSDLPETRGMVFPVQPARVENMWMRNTYIELDMLFIDADGRVTKIIEHAAPMSDTVLSSDNKVAAVLELKGGEVTKLGLHTGDTVHWQPPAGH
jgi:uncharacterized membrane protein (UPF0127 family)